MKRVLYLLALLLGFSVSGWAQYSLYRSVAPGHPGINYSLYLCTPSQTASQCEASPSTAYYDEAGASPITFPLQISSSGIVQIYAASGSYQLLYASADVADAGNFFVPVQFSLGASGPNNWISTANGMKCDDVTDDTAAFNALLTKVNTAGGGIISVSGMCLLNSAEITFPNDGQAQPKQSNIRITSAGAPANGQWGAMPTATAGLDLRFNATDAKLVTLGIGKLEIDHLFLKDGGSDCASFLLATNTTLLFHDNTVSGTAAGASACNDVLVLGGTGTTSGNLVSSMFQGYGTIIQGNWFDKIKRAAILQSAANNVIVRDNTVSLTGGFTTGGAFETNGNSSLSNTGNFFSGNLIEVNHYKYGINLPNFANDNVFIGNSCFDPTATNTSCLNFGAGADFAMVVAGFSADSPQVYMTAADGTATLFTSHQSQVNVMPGPWKFVGGSSNATPLQTSEASSGQISAYDLLNTNNNDEVFQQLTTGPNWNFVMKPAGGAAEIPFIIGRNSSTTTTFAAGKAGDTSVNFQGTSGADLKIGSNNAGNVLWLCGGAFACNSYLDAADIYRAHGIGQRSATSFAGSCTMATSTSCTITLGTTYSAPFCNVTPQGSSAIAGACSVSGATVTVTAASSNSLTWAAFVWGNPN